MTDRVFPNLFIIGAMKCGTTSLHECLGQHPEIFMTSFKEPQYFAPHRKKHHGVWGQGGDLPEPGVEWYLKLFEGAGDAQFAGESSTSYTKEPWMTGCAERIHAFNPDARLIYLMRDPVERALSHYWYNVRGGSESRPPLDAIREDEQYVAFGDYARQLRPYYKRFGTEAVHLLTLEELVGRPTETLDRLCRWLGVDPRGRDLSFEARNIGSSSMRRLRPAFRGFRTLQRHWRWRELERNHRWLARLTRQLAYRPVQRDPAEDMAVREYLRPICTEQVRALSACTGRDFGEWTSVLAGVPRADQVETAVS
jgi:hypothetical protein